MTYFSLLAGKKICFRQFKLVLVALLLSPHFGIAQGGTTNPDNFQKMTDILPPAPNAAALAKYGGIEINQNTGAPNIAIPLMDVKGKYLTVPVSLNYSSSGIKVDEIASRAGMGWVLKAGGVITRTVRGWADETHTRKIPWGPVGVNWQTFRFFKEATDGWFFNGFDSEPDLFTFSYPGGGGSFVLDAGMNVVQETYSNQKIIHNFTNQEWNFIITTADGTQFYFGGVAAVEKNKRLNNCAKNFDGYTTTAWYLTKIKHVSGEEILFNYSPITYSYDCGVSQSSIYTFFAPEMEGILCPANANGCAGAQAQAVAQPTCINKTTVNGVLLQNITCNNTYQQINIFYVNRVDCNDKLISVVEKKNLLTNSVDRSFTLAHTTVTSASNQYPGEFETGIDKTPYLTALIESVPGGTSGSKTHRFTYHDPTSRPKRLSFAQDHWGYFNGKANTSLLPRPSISDAQMLSRFPECTANREPDVIFASKGMLSKITYPTGGIDSLIYESNEYVGNGESRRLQHVLNCSATGKNSTDPDIRTNVINVGGDQTMELKITVLNSDPTGFYDPMHDFGRIYITGNGGSVFDELFNPGTVNTRYITLANVGNGPTAYTVTLIGQRSSTITAQIELKYYSAKVTASNVNRITGGIRVRSVLTSNEGNLPMEKRYYYGELNSLTTSSSNQVQDVNYVKQYKTRTTCFAPLPPYFSGKNYCSRTAMYSSSLVGLYDYKSSPVSYASVVESIGANFEGGGTQTRFVAVSDQRGQIMWGNDILGAPMTSFSNFGNGNPTLIYQFKKGANGSYIPVKKTEMTYALDSRGFKSVWGYNVNRKYDFGPMVPTDDSTCSLNPSCPDYAGALGVLQDNLECFDAIAYEFPSYWIYNDKKTETAYDQNGQNPIVTQTNNYYDDDQHLQLSRSEVINSRGELIKTAFKYPDDYTDPVYVEMTSRNILNPVVNIITYNGIEKTSEVKNNYYKDLSTFNYLISSVDQSLGNNAPEQIGTISIYDLKGNICEFTGKDDVKNVIIWGYNYMYPVAKISGATYVSVIAALPGGVASIQSLDGQPLRDALNAIRSALPTAFVTSYTYRHLAGVTSITDPVNRTSKYEYDGYGRLLYIIDPDGNIVKKNEYTYSPNYLEKFGVFVNDGASGTYYTQNCNYGYVGSAVTYSVPQGIFYSLISVQDANQKAQALLNANGQAFANKYGNCVTQTVCTGEGYKFTGCLCELGTKVCLNATANPDGTWTMQYRYQWSDGSTSQIYTSLAPPCSGEGKKRIGCSCVLGTKIYTSSVRMKGPNGLYWICTYHYQWPDGSISQDYTETSSTSSCGLTIE
jgi:YD repeat-containing protein